MWSVATTVMTTKTMRNLWPLLMAGSIGAMGVQVASAEDYQLLVGSYTCLLYTSDAADE